MRNIIITLITLCVSFNILAKQNDNYVCEKIISEKNNLSPMLEKLPEIIQIVYIYNYFSIVICKRFFS